MAFFSSSHLHQIKYDVFISFRGTDIRHGFLSHLTRELLQNHIDGYVDERLERGDEISLALLKAIEGSEISLIIFSKDYASSKWCLEELEKIIECKEVNHQMVIPVFYNVDPSDVRHQKGTYGDAFVQHEQKLNDDNKEKLQSWRSALNKAANLSGFHYPSNFQNESQLIDEIVKDILNKLDDTYPTESKRLVGFGRNLACVESLLEIDESQEVRIVGIWGMGGIGKTTLARALCDKFSSKFESCCFMDNVREESKKINGLNNLCQKLFSALLDQENINMSDVVKIRSIKRRLSRKKLEYLAGEQLYLGSGSRVIITSRDKHVLVSGGVHAIHEIKELNFQESFELFSLNAFNQSLPRVGYEKLSESVVIYAKGIPLALKVLGSHLHSKSKETWESALKKLQKYPNMQIQNVLKVSYDGLDEAEKEIFLDIAFFFKGEYKDDVISVLDACGLYATSGIDHLLDKALITISYDNIIQMHDLLQEMGEQIVREESVKLPERRSRLKDIEEVYDLLQNNKGTDKIEGIILDASQIKNVHLSADTFRKMPKLRILKIYSKSKGTNVYAPFSLDSFSNNLRYFYWDEYPLKTLPLAFCVEKLVELHMEQSQVKRLWDGVQDLVNLKIVNLSGSKQLIELPDFSMACNLERMILRGCESLWSIHPSILSLHRLDYLNLMSCQALKNLGITDLCCFTSLKKLCLHNCNQVNKMELHILFDALRSLESLWFQHCNNLSEIPDNISVLSLLNDLHLDYSGVKSLPASIKHLLKLRGIYLNCCLRLRYLPELPPFVEHLHVQYCPSLETIFPFTYSILENKGNWDRMDFSFKECVKMDEQSLCNVMKLSHLSMMQAIYKNLSQLEACYPGSTVPKWFRYKEITETSFMIELPQIDSDQLLGFVFCGIIPQFPKPNVCEICFKTLDHKEYKMRTCRVFPFQKLQGDHVFLWFRPYEPILCESGRRKYDDESITCKFTCVLSDEAVPASHVRMITACGVCPIYASKYDNIIEQILESGTKAKRPCDIIDDQQEQLPQRLKKSNKSLYITDENYPRDELQTHFQTRK